MLVVFYKKNLTYEVYLVDPKILLVCGGGTHCPPPPPSFHKLLDKLLTTLHVIMSTNSCTHSNLDYCVNSTGITQVTPSVSQRRSRKPDSRLGD